jgi:Homeodomain-like domain
MAQIGRPTKFLPIFVDQAAKLAKQGQTRVEIAEFLGITYETFRRWEYAYPAFCEALKVPMEMADARVERSLYERAIGYTVQKEAVVVIKTGRYTSEAVSVPYLDRTPPETAACIFWLKNRKPTEWRDKREYDLGDGILWVEYDPTKPPKGYGRKRLAAPEAA